MSLLCQTDRRLSSMFLKNIDIRRKRKQYDILLYFILVHLNTDEMKLLSIVTAQFKVHG